MLKIGLLAVKKGVSNKINIGDYIQALAAKQFVGEPDVFIERETDLKVYDGDPIKMIMNGWYMNHPENWPPSSKIKPLFVAFHINKTGLPGLLNDDSIHYLKQNEPIGCRDTNSVKLLREKGVDSYFSGCMTLTLGRSYKCEKKNGKVYVVEPHSIRTIGLKSNKLQFLKLICFLLCNFCDIRVVMSKKNEKGLHALLDNAYYLMKYSQRFDYKMLVEAEYINQYNYDIIKKYPTQEDLLGYAEDLVKKYAEASCVITSRIHCALPCLSLDTPVIFVDNEKDNEYSTMRFGGLIKLFNIMVWDGRELKGFEILKKINIENFPRNKDDWKEYANNLTKRCIEYMQKL